MKKLITLKVEKHRENKKEYYVATSDDVQWLVAEWKTLEEAIENAYQIAKVLLVEQKKNKKSGFLSSVPQIFSYSLIIES